MNNEIGTIDLLELFKICKKNLSLFISICLFTGALAFCFTKYFVKEEFSANAKIIVVQKNDTTTNQQNYTYTYSDVQVSQKLADTYSEIIMSEAISNDVVNNLNLDELYGISSSDFSKIVSVSSVNSTEVISITVVTFDPKLSADIANEIVSVFEEKIYNIMQIENVTSLTEAKVPSKKSSPSISKNTLIGVLLGAVICGVIAVVILLTDTKVKNEDDVKRIFEDFNYHIIGNIPELEISGDGYNE